jgi:hypothetical protein
LECASPLVIWGGFGICDDFDYVSGAFSMSTARGDRPGGRRRPTGVGCSIGLFSGTGILPVRTGTHGRDARATRGGFEAVVGFVPFELDAAAPVEGVLHSSKFAAEMLHAFHAFEGIFHGLQSPDALAKLEEEIIAHGFEGVVAFVVFLDFSFFFGEAVEPIDALLMKEPVLVAGATPFGEVLMGDGFASEQVGHDFLGFGQAVDPREDGAAEFAVVEAAV